MPSIFYSTLRTIILERAISGLFEAVTKSFSSFDLLNGIREFDELHVIKLNYDINGYKKYVIVQNVRILAINQKSDNIIEIGCFGKLHGAYSRTYGFIRITRIVKVLESDKSVLVVEQDYAKLR